MQFRRLSANREGSQPVDELSEGSMNYIDDSGSREDGVVGGGWLVGSGG